MLAVGTRADRSPCLACPLLLSRPCRKKKSKTLKTAKEEATGSSSTGGGTGSGGGSGGGRRKTDAEKRFEEIQRERVRLVLLLEPEQRWKERGVEQVRMSARPWSALSVALMGERHEDVVLTNTPDSLPGDSPVEREYSSAHFVPRPHQLAKASDSLLLTHLMPARSSPSGSQRPPGRRTRTAWPSSTKSSRACQSTSGPCARLPLLFPRCLSSER